MEAGPAIAVYPGSLPNILELFASFPPDNDWDRLFMDAITEVLMPKKLLEDCISAFVLSLVVAVPFVLLLWAIDIRNGGSHKYPHCHTNQK